MKRYFCDQCGGETDQAIPILVPPDSALANLPRTPEGHIDWDAPDDTQKKSAGDD